MKKFVIFELKYIFKVGFKWVEICRYNRERFINKIAISQIYDEFPIMSNISCDMSEKTLSYNIKSYDYNSRLYVPKYYLGKVCKDKYGIDCIKHIPVEKIKSEVDNKVLDLLNKREKNQVKYKAKYIDNYVFRETPVPYTGNGRGKYYRQPRLNSVRRGILSEDYRLLNIKLRESYGDLPLWYDDRVRHLDKSWKSSCKVKKQYEKHFRKHFDTCILNKRLWIDEEYIDIIDNAV